MVTSVVVRLIVLISVALSKWVLEQTRVSSRMCAAILSKLPVESIRNVLSSTQISYIESQL